MPPEWPKQVSIFLHSNKEVNLAIGDTIGLSEEANRLFMYAAYEVELIVSVEQNGTANILGIKKEKS